VTGSLRHWLLKTAILCVIVLPHLPAINARFTYDDREFVKRNAAVYSLNAAFAQFVNPFPPEQPERGLYRPLTAVSYALDCLLWGPGPQGFHISNILYYVMTIVFVWLLARTYFKTLTAAVLVSLLFGLHPVHCEVVDSIAGRS